MSSVKKSSPSSQVHWDDITLDDKGHVRTKAIHNYSPWLSNLYPYSKFKMFSEQPVIVYFNDLTFSSAEAAYQYAKARFFDERLTDSKYPNSYISKKQNQEDQNVISRHFPCKICPLKAKKSGGKGNYATYIASVYGNKTKASKLVNEIMPDWYQVSMFIMEQIIASKFDAKVNPKFVSLLLATGDRKIYETRGRGGSIWEKGGTKSGYGALGDMLMARRKTIIAETADVSQTSSSIEVNNNDNSTKRKVMDKNKNNVIRNVKRVKK